MAEHGGVLNRNLFHDFVLSGDIGDGLRLDFIGHEITAVGHTYGPAVRSCYLIHIVTAGHGKFVRGGKTYEISEGNAFLIRPMEITVYGADQDNSWEYYWIGFSGSAAEAIVNYAFPNDCCVASFDKSSVLTFATQHSAVTRGIEDTLALRALLYTLLSGIRRSVSEQQVKKPDIVAQALGFFEANYFRNVNISELARNLGVTRAYFTSQFSARVGRSPYAYLTDLRMEKAKALIAAGSFLSVSEVAYSVGFSSLERFSEMFKKHEGISPQVYKKFLT